MIKAPAQAATVEPAQPPPALAHARALQASDVTARVQQKLELFLNEESERLDHWQEDAEAAFKRQADKPENEIAARQKLSRAPTLGFRDKLDLKREIAALRPRKLH